MDVIAAGGGPAGLMTAALLAAATVRAEVRERGSEPAGQSRGTAIYPRTLEVLTMIDAGDGRPISDALLTQGRRVRDTHCASVPGLLDYRGLDTPLPFTLTIPQRRTEHAPDGYLGVCGGRVRSSAEVTAAGQSADDSRVQVSRARHTARYLAGPDGAHSPSWAGPDEQHRAAGRRQPGLELAATRTGRPDSYATHSVTVIPAVN